MTPSAYFFAFLRWSLEPRISRNQVTLEQLKLCLGHSCNLLLSLPTLSKDEGSIVVGDLQGIHTVVIGFLVPRHVLTAASAVIAPPTSGPALLAPLAVAAVVSLVPAPPGVAAATPHAYL